MELKNITVGAPAPATQAAPYQAPATQGDETVLPPAKPELTTPQALSLADQIKADVGRVERHPDAIGRVIGVKKLNFLDTNRIARVMGKDAENSTALQQAMITASVVEIDGARVSLPATMGQLEALMQRLDFHGIAAALVALNRFAPVGASEMAAEIKN